jgi:exopolyphosphatase/guanosine-5'-triphosphate,3'-diphosphate pyrophosphatase
VAKTAEVWVLVAAMQRQAIRGFMSRVAVIDIGSNSIKILVADRAAGGKFEALKTKTLDARISAGISKAKPELSEDGMKRGLAAIQELLADTAQFLPAKIILVATSAVRDAANGAEFRERVKIATSQEIRILTGDEEANLIGRGLTCDPSLRELRDFYVFDLGGGSLECLSFRDRKITQAISLKLGCVRMTERFVTDVTTPLQQNERTALAVHVRDELKSSGFRFAITAPAAVFTGGSMSTVRAIKGARHGLPFEDTPATIGLSTLTELLDELAPLTLQERKALPGMPAARADVFSAALVTMISLADYAHIDRFHHSLYNLRWGLAAEILEK